MMASAIGPDHTGSIFLDLPRELRDHIYSFVIPFVALHGRSQILGLLLSCRQVKAEFWQQCLDTIEFPIGVQPGDVRNTALLSFVKSLNKRDGRMLKALRLRFTEEPSSKFFIAVTGYWDWMQDLSHELREKPFSIHVIVKHPKPVRYSPLVNGIHGLVVKSEPSNINGFMKVVSQSFAFELYY